MPEATSTRHCPFCKEEIKSDAVRCKHCHASIRAEQPAHNGVCPYCKETINPEAVKCKHCGSWVGSESRAAGGCGCGGSQAAAGPVDLFRSRPGTGGVGSGGSGPVVVAQQAASCGPCEYGGMIDPFSGVSYGLRRCCQLVRIPGIPVPVNYCWTEVCGTQPFPVYGGPVIYA
jgi:hypothetical protein